MGQTAGSSGVYLILSRVFWSVCLKLFLPRNPEKRVGGFRQSRRKSASETLQGGVTLAHLGAAPSPD